jgi:hypothetical protein
MNKYVTINQPSLSAVDLKTYSQATINWSANPFLGGASSEAAREMAKALLDAADEVDEINRKLNDKGSSMECFTEKATGIQWAYKLIEKGDVYGKTGALKHDQDDPIIQFYKVLTHEDHQKERYFVSSYYLSTFLNIYMQGLNLDDTNEEYFLSEKTVNQIQNKIYESRSMDKVIAISLLSRNVEYWQGQEDVWTGYDHIKFKDAPIGVDINVFLNPKDQNYDIAVYALSTYDTGENCHTRVNTEDGPIFSFKMTPDEMQKTFKGIDLCCSDNASSPAM